MGSGIRELKKPNLFIIGVHKAGTTSLFEYLTAHPEICGSKRKEVHYYTPLILNKPIAPFPTYLRQFKKCRNEKYLLDASPSYLYGGRRIAERMKEELGKIKILVILRNPTERFISFYRSLKSTLRLRKSEDVGEFLRNCIKCVGNDCQGNFYSRALSEGFYIDYLKEWFEVFFSEQIRIIFFDDLSSSPGIMMKNIAEWLEIDPKIYESGRLFRVSNKTVIPKFSGVHKILLFVNRKFEYFFRTFPGMKKHLRDFYYLLNGSNNRESISSEIIEALDKIYFEKNLLLSEFLKEKGINKLPKWLN